MATITRERRADANGETVIAYYRDPTIHLVYRYADDTAPYMLISGGSDRIIGGFDTVAELEQHVKELL